MRKLLLRNTFFFFFLPVFFYCLFFAFYTFPWITHFSTSFFGDNGDTLQNVWNIWWIHTAVQAHQSIWQTFLLHYPEGTTLLGHTLNPINGYLALLLLPFMSLNQAYNSIVIFSFLATGLTTFWLCYSISKNYTGSLLGGFAFTFCSYHFAHAFGHLNLITLEYVPLFLLSWHAFLKKPGYALAVANGILLLAVEFSDFYYLLFSIVAAIIFGIYFLVRRQIVWNREAFFSYLLTGASLALFALPLPLAVIHANAHDPFIGGHDPRYYGLNLPFILIPGEIWHFANLTQNYWKYNTLGVVEGTTSIGIVVSIAVIVALLWRRRFTADTLPWLFIALFFAALSVGTNVHYFGSILGSRHTPYALFVNLFPSLSLAGVPVRMIVMTMLAGAVLLSIVLAPVKKWKFPFAPLFLAITFIAIAIEAWPGPLPMISAQHPTYVDALHALPPGGVLDTKDSKSYALYYQTIFQKPLVYGYISRVSTSVMKDDATLQSWFDQGNYAALAKVNIQYWLANTSTTPVALPIAYKDSEAVIYKLGNR